MSECSYRTASLHDLNEIETIEKTCFQKGEAFSRKNLRYLLTNPYRTFFNEIILQGETIVGWASWLTRKTNKYTIRLYSLAILPSFRGQGIAETYLRKRLALWAHHYTFCSLEVRSSNKPAISLYQRLGFTPVAILPHYYGEEDGMRMKCSLINFLPQ